MPQAANDNVPYRISWLIGGLMISIAALIDILQFLAIFLNIIPGLGVVVDFYLAFLGYSIFTVWFMLQRVSFTSGKRAVSKILTTSVSILAELMPLLDALPALTTNVTMIILMARAEDRESAKERAAQEAAQMEAYFAHAAQIDAANARRMEQVAANDTEEGAQAA